MCLPKYIFSSYYIRQEIGKDDIDIDKEKCAQEFSTIDSDISCNFI